MTASRKCLACFSATPLPSCSSAFCSLSVRRLSSSVSFVSSSSSLLALDRLAARRLHRRHALRDLLLVLERRRQDVAVGHQHHQLAFDVDGLVVGLDHDLVARVQLALVEHLVLLEQADHLLGDQLRQRVDRVLQVQQPALARFLLPLRRVVVAVEDDPLVLLDHLRQQLGDRLSRASCRP